MDAKLKADFDFITDTFTGADGGVAFMAFKMTLEELSKKDDAGSKELLDITIKFAKFVRATKRMHFPEIDL